MSYLPIDLCVGFVGADARCLGRCPALLYVTDIPRAHRGNGGLWLRTTDSSTRALAACGGVRWRWVSVAASVCPERVRGGLVVPGIRLFFRPLCERSACSQVGERIQVGQRLSVALIIFCR